MVGYGVLTMTMKYFFSPTTNGFYIDVLNPVMPEDVFEITPEQHKALLDGQSQGKTIAFKSRKLQLLEPAEIEKTWEDIRARRDRLLTESDWTQILDNGVSQEIKDKWKVYRQKLRDITETFSDPNQVVWPMAPAEE